MRKTMHKPVILVDFHGVFIKGGYEIAARKISKKYNIPQGIILDALDHKNWYRKKYGIGKMGTKEFWDILAKKLGTERGKMREIGDLWHSSYTIDKGMAKTVRKLRGKYRVIVLSGNFQDRVKFLNKRYGLKKVFHEQHYSFDYGINKPDARLFSRAVKKMNLRPQDCIMIDDLPDFLAGVRKKGGKTILFRNAKQTEIELKKMGVVL